MPSGKKVKPEQIIRLLRDAEVAMAEGMKAVEFCRKHSISTKSFYR